MKSPTPHQIMKTRMDAGLTQTEAGSLVYAALRTWQDWEYGNRKMSPANWELFTIKLGKIKPTHKPSVSS